jgi:hypothetical protein
MFGEIRGWDLVQGDHIVCIFIFLFLHIVVVM